MRKLLYISLLIGALVGLSQSVEFEDANFKQCFIDNYPELLNADNKLIISEANAYTDTLQCRDYGIVSVPELIYFESLTRLEINRNEITELPSLDNLKALTFFYVAENNLTALPSMDSLLNLEELICWKNQITELPDITHMSKLYRLDVPVNKLTSFPQLPPNAPLRTLLVDDNLITDLPDLSAYTDLEIVKIVNNKMNFNELEKILTQPNGTYYDYYPQKNLSILANQVFDEGDTATLSLYHNLNEQTHVQWLQNSTPLADTSDALSFAPAQLDDAGIYSVILTSDLFPNKPLYSNAVQVSVRDCPEFEDIQIEVINSNCTTPGSIDFQPSDSYSYQLENLFTNQVKTDGFSQLSQGEYQLEVSTAEGCSRTYSENIIIEKEDCEEVLISPNGDGYQDEFYFSQEGSAIVTDKFGNKVTELTLPTYWDGRVNDTPLSPGYYLLTIDGGKQVMGLTIVY